MKAAMLGLLAETPIHPGSGRSVGVIDLPVAREAGTDYPVLVGSSLKGALRDRARGLKIDEDVIFGKPDQAGDLSVSDARLLLLPVRSLTGAYRWVTCPHLIERYGRDLARSGIPGAPGLPKVEPGKALAQVEDTLFLEEREFEVQNAPHEALANSFTPLLLHTTTRQRIQEQLTVLHDNDFAWFARYGLSVQARNDLENETKRSKNLWYEESLPPDTVMYAVVAGRSEEAIAALRELFPEGDCYLQAGGNETVGHGWFAVQVRMEAG